ncbi:MAG: TPM domain-containing protein [Verrucomicrobiota bacterium]
MPRLLRISLLWLLAWLPLLQAQEASSPSSPFPKRENRQVADLAEILSATQLSQLERDLASFQESDGIDVFLLTLPGSKDDYPEDSVGQLAHSWGGRSALGAMVLSFSAEPQTPLVVPLGTQLKQIRSQNPQQLVDLALQRAASAGAPAAVLDRLCREMAEELRILAQRNNYRASEVQRKIEAADGLAPSAPLGTPSETWQSWLPAAIGLAAGGLVILAIVLKLALFTNRLRQNFPNVKPRTRLGAPYSGGNNAAIRLKL